MEEPQFLVQWEEHPTHLASRLGYLLEHQSLVDVTLMCNTHTLRVHRAVLAACSPYFERQLGNHPLIVLKDMKFSVLKSLVEFMYCGETSVSEENLSPLLEAAKFFQVKGLASMTKESVFSNGSGTKVNGTSHFSPSHTPVNNGVRGGRGRGRGRGGRTPISPKVGSPTESAQILLSLSGGAAAPQFVTTPRNVKIDTSLLEGRQPAKATTESMPRRRGRRRVPANTAVRDRFFKSEANVGDENSPLLSSLLGKEGEESEAGVKGIENTPYNQTLKELGLPTNVPILYDNGQGKLVKLTEDVLRSVITSDGSVQLQVTEATSPSPTTSTKGVKSESVDKENKNFLVKEMAVQNKTTNGEVREMPKVIVKPAMDESVSEQFNDTALETLKNGVAAEAESEPDAVVLYEICDNKKLHKCVLSAKDIQSVKELNEQLSKQKKQLADMTKDNISTVDAGNTNVAELKLKIRKTTSVLSQIVEKVKGFKNMKDMKALAMKMLDEEKAQSQVVQLEFINGDGEKIEGYQVEGTVVEKKRREEAGELMGLLDMVCDGGEGLLEEKEKEELEAMGQDVLLEATSDEASDYLMAQEESGLPYDQIDDMIHHSPSADDKQHLKYIIDSDGNIINSDDNYVVYKEDTSNEYVIYDSAEPVLPMADHPDFHDRTDTNSDFISPHKRLPMEVSDSPADTHYIIYDDNNKSPPHFEDSHKPQFVFDKTESSVERLLDKDRVPSVNFNSFEDKFESFSEEHCDRTSETSSNGELISVKRRTSIASDSSDNSSKKQKLQTSLVDDDNDSL